jgi:hypothetical protein
MALGLEQSCGRIRVLPATGCWEYQGAHDAFGYGRVFLAGKERKAQRVYYEVFVGPLPQTARLKHHLPAGRCLGARCCNPAHLRVQLSFTTITVPERYCKQGHRIDATNATIEQRDNSLVVRCRLCRQESDRNAKRAARKGTAKLVLATTCDDPCWSNGSELRIMVSGQMIAKTVISQSSAGSEEDRISAAATADSASVSLPKPLTPRNTSPSV